MDHLGQQGLTSVLKLLKLIAVRRSISLAYRRGRHIVTLRRRVAVHGDYVIWGPRPNDQRDELYNCILGTGAMTAVLPI